MSKSVACSKCGFPTTAASGKHGGKDKCLECGRCTDAKMGQCQGCIEMERETRKSPKCSRCLKVVNLLEFARRRRAGEDPIVHECGRILYTSRVASWSERHPERKEA